MNNLIDVIILTLLGIPFFLFFMNAKTTWQRVVVVLLYLSLATLVFLTLQGGR